MNKMRMIKYVDALLWRIEHRIDTYRGVLEDKVLDPLDARKKKLCYFLTMIEDEEHNEKRLEALTCGVEELEKDVVDLVYKYWKAKDEINVD